jgi:type II restriction/modification system DNA methylase subunit YeeA
LKVELAPAYKKQKGTGKDRQKIAAFLKKLSSITVLDPACGSGNFLYVSLQLLLDLEKEAITFATQLGFEFQPKVSVQQLKAIEINPYAFELAQVSVQIGYLQWRRDNGFDNDRTPVLQNLKAFENKDALLYETFRKKPKNLKAARREEHHRQEELFKVYIERAWPECDVIVGNPPFLGDKFMRRELGDSYVDDLRAIYGNRIPGQSDFCCYWFEKARDLIEHQKCKRAGLLATQGIRGGANREVLSRIKETGNIFFAESDREWILAGANVHVSMVGFDDGTEKERTLNGSEVTSINANLSGAADTTKAAVLDRNEGLSFLGSCKGGSFDLPEDDAVTLLQQTGNPHGKPNSDLIRPVVNSEDLIKTASRRWIIDTAALTLDETALYEMPYKLLVDRVKPVRDVNRDKWLRENWWRPQRMRPEMRAAVRTLDRFLITTTTSKHRLFVWLRHPTLPDHQLIVFSRDDDYFFGVLHSRIHEVWALAQGTQLREKESGFRYTPTTCFETFPLPRPKAEQENTISIAAKELNSLRERWLNPPEWTTERVLEFPGSTSGPWANYVTNSDRNGIGTVRYPRLEPKDPLCATKLKKRTLTNLYNERPAWLDLAHKKLDEAVAAAYGWPGNLSDDQILERLLALNLEHAAEEKKQTPSRARVSRSKNDDELL